ncbi:uncharacterized protein LOC132543601 [Ylistrum balloti]|uniref:uncharacterized protein LOC132543601 n=1 Tax=Ylistrum balloti TaxID=509963 RepID=UPI0029058678|nr:uncharacterized protein LOC132543601 [Ylistrum balloti]
MNSSMNTILCACVLWICVTISTSGYVKRGTLGECVRVCHPHHPTWIKKMFRYCIVEDDCVYCKYYGCPELKECKRRRVVVPPEPTLDRNCMICPGTCVYAGKIFNRRDRFKAVDGVNECQCQNVGKVRCSKKPNPSPRKFCGV